MWWLFWGGLGSLKETPIGVLDQSLSLQGGERTAGGRRGRGRPTGGLHSPTGRERMAGRTEGLTLEVGRSVRTPDPF